MRKIILTLIAAFALCFALESFGVELVSANYSYKFKVAPKPQQSPPKTSDRKDDEETKKNLPLTSSTTPKKSATPTKTANNLSQTSQEQYSQTEATQTEQNTNSQKNKKTGTNDESKSEGWFDNIWTLLLYVVGGIVGLSVLGLLGWLIYSTISNALSSEREGIQQGFRSAEKRNQELRSRIEKLEQVGKLQSGQFEQCKTAIQALERRIMEIGGQGYQQQAIFTPPVQKPEPKFPTAAEDYLGKISANAQTATADLIGGLLVNDSNKGNEFLIVRDSELPGNLFYAVPNQTRFQTKSDYLNYYQNYYACENPSGGAVWIKAPTTVRRVEGGWKLEDMGELEIR